MDRWLLLSLKRTCPQFSNVDRTANLDQNPFSSAVVDKSFYSQIMQRRGVLQIDQELALDSLTKSTVKAIARSTSSLVKRCTRLEQSPSVSIATILTSLGSPIGNDDMVTISLEGLPDKYDNVSGIIVHREPFTDLKTVRSMLTTEEMWLKSRAQATSIDSTSSSLIVLLANKCNNTRCLNVSPKKVNKPCFNFARGFCYFGETCKFIHRGTSNGVNGNNSLWSTSNVRPTSSLTTTHNMTQEQMMALIHTQQALMAKFRYHGNQGVGQSCIGTQAVHLRNGNNVTPGPVALHTRAYGPAQSFASFSSPPGFRSNSSINRPTLVRPNNNVNRPNSNINRPNPLL
ncbi:hybrid signal transduction histidine kinase M [Tanacetum coccineum]